MTLVKCPFCQTVVEGWLFAAHQCESLIFQPTRVEADGVPMEVFELNFGPKQPPAVFRTTSNNDQVRLPQKATPVADICQKPPDGLPRERNGRFRATYPKQARPRESHQTEANDIPTRLKRNNKRATIARKPSFHPRKRKETLPNQMSNNNADLQHERRRFHEAITKAQQPSVMTAADIEACLQTVAEEMAACRNNETSQSFQPESESSRLNSTVENEITDEIAQVLSQLTKTRIPASQREEIDDRPETVHETSKQVDDDKNRRKADFDPPETRNDSLQLFDVEEAAGIADSSTSPHQAGTSTSTRWSQTILETAKCGICNNHVAASSLLLLPCCSAQSACFWCLFNISSAEKPIECAACQFSMTPPS